MHLLAGALLAALLLPLSALPLLFLLGIVTLARPRFESVWKNAPADYLMLAWSVWPPLTLFWSMATGLAMETLAGLLCLPMSYWAGRKLIQQYPQHQEVALALSWGLLALLAVWGAIQNPGDLYTGKPQGPFIDPNTYAGTLNLLALPLVAAYLQTDLRSTPPWVRTGWLAILAVAAFAFLLVSSRGATLTLLVLLPLLLWQGRHGPDLRRKLALLFVAVFAAYGAANLCISERSEIIYRLVATTQTGDSSRMMLFRSAWAMIENQPWIGTGLGSFRLLYPRFRHPDEIGSAGGWVHNDYLQLWQEAGLPMLLGLVALVFLVARSGLKNSSDNPALLGKLGHCWSFGILAVLLQAVVNFMVYFAFLACVIGFYLALAGERGLLPRTVSSQHLRAKNWARYAYGFLLAYLLIGLLAVEALTSPNRRFQSFVAAATGNSSRYEASHIVSIIQPHHHAPHYLMGSFLADPFHVLTGGPAIRGAMLREALIHYDRASELAPCYLPYGVEMAKVWAEIPSIQGRTGAEKALRDNLGCNPGHGLSHYHLARLVQKTQGRDQAIPIYRKGLELSPQPIDRLLLATAAAGLIANDNGRLTKLADDMAMRLLFMERNPMAAIDPRYWQEAEYTLFAHDPRLYMRWVANTNKP